MYRETAFILNSLTSVAQQGEVELCCRQNLPVLVKDTITRKQELAYIQLYYQLPKRQKINSCEPKVMSRLRFVGIW